MLEDLAPQLKMLNVSGMDAIVQETLSPVFLCLLVFVCFALCCVVKYSSSSPLLDPEEMREAGDPGDERLPQDLQGAVL